MKEPGTCEAPGSWYDNAGLRPANEESNESLPLPIRRFPNSPSCSGRSLGCAGFASEL